MLKLNARQDMMVRDFIRTARASGLRDLAAALPSNDRLMQGAGLERIGQLRGLRGFLAVGFDELGNRSVLTQDCRVLQLFPGEHI